MIVVATDPDGLDAASQRVVGLGARPVTISAPARGRRVLLAAVDDVWREDAAIRALRADGWVAVARPDDGIRLDAWRRHTRPIEVGERLTISFAWSEHDRCAAPGLVELGLGGFGNGDHPATRLLLDALVRRVAPGDRVLDVGCGSGVLGLAALRLGAGSLVAMDIKPAAVEATRRNAELNGLGGLVTATDAPPADLDGPFGVIVANVGRAVAVDLAADLRRLLAPGGWLAVSGFSPPQCSSVAGALAPLIEAERRTNGDWAAMIATRAPC